ncbi:MAG: N-acetyl-gamma-glutamyl-phosphate reductase [Deltaproteobacteria bacterium]|nr:N-acetyl-gamma-glutamyl-phosphate reductase [Deltaproteobacteria bacterium]
MARLRIGLVGARGYVGSELVALVEAHPALELAWAASRSGAGTVGHVALEELTPADVERRGADAVVLALPNGQAAAWLPSLEKVPVVVDLSADQRFNDAWVYGLPELHRARIRSARRIANPGCYATGIQLGLAPLLPLLAETPHVFGVSGYSGAGTTPADKNNPEKLRDNLMPYSLIDHAHEREVSHHLGRPVHFMPHVAPFFRGITLTMSMVLRQPRDRDALRALFQERYGAEPLVRIVDDTPLVRDAVGSHRVTLGSITTAGPRAVLVVTLDNLLKGAATQALQNINLALGRDEFEGIPIHG